METTASDPLCTHRDLRADPLVHAFETTTLDVTRFHHREHLYVAWRYLRMLPLEAAVARYVSHLQRLTVAVGAADKFHATITWAYLLLQHDAMARFPDATFEQLLELAPRLLQPPALAFVQYYDAEVLSSEEARRRLVLPRRA